MKNQIRISSLDVTGCHRGIIMALEYAGGRKELAELLGVSVSAINYYQYTSHELPIKRALLAHIMLGIPMHDLRPDLFKKEGK